MGFTFTNSVERPQIRLHWKTVKRMKERVRDLTGRSSGRSVKRVVGDLTLFLRGWWNYFGLIRSRNRLARLDVWIHRRLRALIWKQWKRARTRIAELMARGIPKAFAVPVGGLVKRYTAPYSSRFAGLHLAINGITGRQLRNPQII